MTVLAPTLLAFLIDRLIRQRQASSHAVAAYRDTLRMLLNYAAAQTGVLPSRLDLTQLDAPTIGAFLDHLEHERGNSVHTRNARLAAIQSLFHFAALLHSEHAASISRVLAIPPKRCDQALITYLADQEITALLAAPDPDTWTGRRDRALLLVAIQAGLRISELTGLTIADVSGYGRSITNGLHRQRRRIGSSRLARLSLVATAANGVSQQQARAWGNRAQHEYGIERGDRDPGGRAEPGCAEGPGGGSFPQPPPADTQGDHHRSLDHHQQRDQFAQGCGAAGDPGRDDERGRVPGDDQHRGQRELGPHAWGQQAVTKVSGDGPGGACQPRPAAASSATHDQRSTPDYAGDTRQNIRQRAPNRRGHGQQHDGRHHGLDDLTAQPFPRHRAQPTPHLSSAPAMRNGPVHVAENPADEHGVEEQGLVVGADRAGQADANAECPGDDPPPPGRAHRGQESERDGSHDRLPGDRTQPVLERRRAHLPPEKPQHGDAGGQAQQRRAEAAGRPELSVGTPHRAIRVGWPHCSTVRLRQRGAGGRPR
jgi:site-specific recombinase XerC